MQYPHWLMVAGAVLVVVGFIGFALHRNNAEPVENNLKQEAAPPEEPAERKDFRSREAREAIADQEEAQRALHGNLERLREEHLTRETAARPMLYPAPELPDDTPIENVRFSTRIRNA
jgi:hypothetical protein